MAPKFGGVFRDHCLSSAGHVITIPYGVGVAQGKLEHIYFSQAIRSIVVLFVQTPEQYEQF